MSHKGVGIAGMVMIVLGSVGIPAGTRLARAEDGGEAKTGVEAKAAFARLKTLAGTWKVQLGGDHESAKAKEHQDKHDTSPATVTFGLTGAGSTVVETQFPGKGHEMISMYHLDGADLRMTHDCAAGNQPRLKLDRAYSQPDHLTFSSTEAPTSIPRKTFTSTDSRSVSATRTMSPVRGKATRAASPWEPTSST